MTSMENARLAEDSVSPAVAPGTNRRRALWRGCALAGIAAVISVVPVQAVNAAGFPGGRLDATTGYCGQIYITDQGGRYLYNQCGLDGAFTISDSFSNSASLCFIESGDSISLDYGMGAVFSGSAPGNQTWCS